MSSCISQRSLAERCSHVFFTLILFIDYSLSLNLFTKFSYILKVSVWLTSKILSFVNLKQRPLGQGSFHFINEEAQGQMFAVHTRLAWLDKLSSTVGKSGSNDKRSRNVMKDK